MGTHLSTKILTATFFGAILTICAAWCWIIRLPCKKEASFTVIVRGHVLKNCKIGESSVPEVEQCYEYCINHHGCKSINYKDDGEKNCQLNSKVKEAASVNDFEADGVWTYYATNYNKTNIGTYCEDYAPCPTGTYCIDTCQCPGYQCIECIPGYRVKYEPFCTDINECDSNPCQHGATCVNDVNRFQCTCMPGYSGALCENDINECGSDPCKNGAACTNHVNRFHCSCAPGYNGVRCENEVNECASNPCQHGGQCNDHLNSFSCTCLQNTYGTRCESTHYGSCKAAFDDGHRSNGAYHLTIGLHYCELTGFICGGGGWTLAVKSRGDSGVFHVGSAFWTTTQNLFRTPSLGIDDAKYQAFNVLSFNKICLAIKKYHENTYKTLVVDKTSSSLLSIFGGGELQISLSRATWLALRPDAYLQPNCNYNGFNIKDWHGRLVVRFGIMMNNEFICWTPDSAIGIGIGSYQRLYMRDRGDPSQYMAYLFVK